MIRIVGERELHRAGEDADPNLGRTPCGIRYVPGDWPRLIARPRLPRCAECFR